MISLSPLIRMLMKALSFSKKLNPSESTKKSLRRKPKKRMKLLR
jgi:hypothetical protein